MKEVTSFVCHKARCHVGQERKRGACLHTTSAGLAGTFSAPVLREYLSLGAGSETRPDPTAPGAACQDGGLENTSFRVACVCSVYELYACASCTWPAFVFCSIFRTQHNVYMSRTIVLINASISKY